MPGNPTQSRAGDLKPVEGFSNSILVCVDCHEEFVFTASAQKYFADRDFHDPPKRCKSCYGEFRKKTDEPDQEKPDDAEAAAQPAARQESSIVPETSAGPTTQEEKPQDNRDSQAEESSAA